VDEVTVKQRILDRVVAFVKEQFSMEVVPLSKVPERQHILRRTTSLNQLGQRRDLEEGGETFRKSYPLTS